MSSQPSDPRPEGRLGEIVDARYRIVKHLGSGGMAAVYRAEHVHNAAPVAIKVLHKEFSNHPEASARFQREALAARRIQHPNVVAVMDFGRLPDGCLYMVLEFIRGEDLCVVLHREKPFSEARATKIALQVAHALVSAHRAGIVHRDLKPENIMLVERGGDRDFVKVVDFGIAKVAMQRGPALTALGSVFGTPEYMAPEQARGAVADHRTDLYALGVVLYEMLAGATPFADDQVAVVIMSQITKPPPPLPPSVDPELAALVMQLLAKQPSDRVQSAEALVERLRAILGRLSPGEVVPSLPSAGAMPPSPRPPAVVPAAPAVYAAPPPRPMTSGGGAAIPVVPVMSVAQSGTPGPIVSGGFAPVAPSPLHAPPASIVAEAPGGMGHANTPAYFAAAPAYSTAGPGYSTAGPGYSTVGAESPAALPLHSPPAIHPVAPPLAAKPVPATAQRPGKNAVLVGCAAAGLVFLAIAVLLARLILSML